MSVANQANEKLTQLVTLTAKIESYLNPAKKGKGGGQAGAQVAGDGATGGGGANRIKEAIAVGGMAQSLAMSFCSGDTCVFSGDQCDEYDLQPFS